MNVQKLREAFPDVVLPDDNGFYAKIDGWARIFENEPPWLTVKRAGLGKGGKRLLNRLGTAKLLCDEFARKIFAEQADISCGGEIYDKYIYALLDREGFWKNMPALISLAFAQGGCAVREFIENGIVRIGFAEGRSFYPVSWDNKNITEGIFSTVSARSGYYYSFFERHFFSGGNARTESRLYRSSSPDETGIRVPLSELYGDAADHAEYPLTVPLFCYFKPDISNNQQTELPLGVSVFSGCTDTLKALDVAFDSFAREFILGRKRIIVPSSCIRTVINPETGNSERYFDSDDEVYQALRCDEDRDLRITDNTVALRITEHVDGINALLNILCFQTGLSAGSLSFDGIQGMKTATEVISQESKTAVTIRSNKNLLAEFIQSICETALLLAMETGEVPRGVPEVSVAFKDSVIIDDNTLIDNNVKLVSAGLESKLTAIMNVLKCDENTARKELERISEETQAFPAEM